MSKIPVFIDCDPGADDSIALLLAAKMPNVDIVGIGTTCGNVEGEKTYHNGRKIAALAGLDVPVYRGADQPLMRELVTAKYAHGQDGLRGLSSTLAEPEGNETNEKPWDALYREAKAHAGELVLVAVGPMTNVAIALAKYKELPSLLNKIVIMGGSVSWGNITPAAEFNIYADPEAAEMLFKCEAPIYMFGLDVTEKAYITPDEIEEIGKLDSPQAKFCYDIFKSSIDFYLSCGMKGICLHDPSAMMYLAYPELFEGKMAGVCVETKAEITRGKTVCDLFTDVKFPFQNTHVM
ncbi:MAG: nucleoside hydrolase, partial [Clostridiales bacterium]|nr:nucleoside hydrolase [Clostridiales bacterium]